MAKISRLLILVLMISFVLTSGAQSVADAAKASKSTGGSKVIGDDDLDSLRTRAHVSDGPSAGNESFCNASCQNEVIRTFGEKLSRTDAESLLELGLATARADGEWQELIERVQTAVCHEKKTGTQGADDTALQKEFLLRISHEQKSIAELQEKALSTSNPADIDQLKEKSAKLVVIGIGIKQMASGAGCETKQSTN